MKVKSVLLDLRKVCSDYECQVALVGMEISESCLSMFSSGPISSKAPKADLSLPFTNKQHLDSQSFANVIGYQKLYTLTRPGLSCSICPTDSYSNYHGPEVSLSVNSQYNIGLQYNPWLQRSLRYSHKILNLLRKDFESFQGWQKGCNQTAFRGPRGILADVTQTARLLIYLSR